MHHVGIYQRKVGTISFSFYALCMTLIGQHARRSDYVSENSAEGVNNGNVDKIRWCQKVQVRNIFFRFLKNKKHGAL